MHQVTLLALTTSLAALLGALWTPVHAQDRRAARRPVQVSDFSGPRCFAYSTARDEYACTTMSMETSFLGIDGPFGLLTSSVEGVARRNAAAVALGVVWNAGEGHVWPVFRTVWHDEDEGPSFERPQPYRAIAPEAVRRGFDQFTISRRRIFEGSWHSYRGLSVRYDTEHFEGGISGSTHARVQVRCPDGSIRPNVIENGRFTGMTFFAAPRAPSFVVGLFDGASGGEGVWSPSTFYQRVDLSEACQGPPQQGAQQGHPL